MRDIKKIWRCDPKIIENSKRIEKIIIRLREMRMPIMAEVLMTSIENEEFISEEMIDLL